MDAKTVDVSVLRDLYPNPKPSEPTSTCGYCVDGTLMAYLDGITAAMADEGQKPNGRAHYFPRVPELADILKKANPDLPEAMAARYADFITRLNDRRRFSFAWSYLKQALEWKEGINNSSTLTRSVKHGNGVKIAGCSIYPRIEEDKGEGSEFCIVLGVNVPRSSFLRG